MSLSLGTKKFITNKNCNKHLFNMSQVLLKNSLKVGNNVFLKKLNNNFCFLLKNNNRRYFHVKNIVNNNTTTKPINEELKQIKYITIKAPALTKNSTCLIEWHKKEGDLLDDHDLICKIDRQTAVADEIKEIRSDYKGKLHKILIDQPIELLKQQEIKLSPEQEILIIETTEEEIRQQEGLLAKVKRFIKRYGLLGVAVYFGVYFLTLGLLFLLLQQGLLNTKSVLLWLHEKGFDKWIDTSDLQKSSQYANFAVAWVLTKFTEPLRFAITIALTPAVYKLIRRVMRK
ncbi:hypothetical protein ABK040_003355 [Willaertia magna]